MGIRPRRAQQVIPRRATELRLIGSHSVNRRKSCRKRFGVVHDLREFVSESRAVGPGRFLASAHFGVAATAKQSPGNQPVEVAMNARRKHQKQDEGSPQEFTRQLAAALHRTPEATDEWLGLLLARCAEQRQAAAPAAAHAGKSPIPASSAKSQERAAA